ncbi:MAG: outer membrane protein assembly factor BamD [Alphaproteobacteria bacterium]
MKKFLYIVFIFIISSCAVNTKTDYSKLSDKDIYDSAIKNINKENHISAISELSQIEYNHPYSSLVPNSWILTGYTYYKEKKYPEAIETFEKLIKYQPNHRDVPYAMYMIAICYYDQISPISRDQKMTELALINMERLKKTFPDSEYTKDVLPKIIIARNNLAAKEMYIAKNLMKKKNMIAALNRLQTIIAKYDTTLFIEEALYRTVEIYLILMEPDDANNMLRLLEHNYPNSTWTTSAKDLIKSYNEKQNKKN